MIQWLRQLLRDLPKPPSPHGGDGHSAPASPPPENSLSFQSLSLVVGTATAQRSHQTKQRATRLRTLSSFCREDTGSVAITVAVSLTAILGIMGLAIDVGQLRLAQQRLQMTAGAAPRPIALR